MRMVKKRIEELVKGIEIGFRCKGKVTYPSVYHQVYNTSGLTEEFMQFVSDHQLADVRTAKEAMTGEDFGYMLKNIPALCSGWGRFIPRASSRQAEPG